MNGEGKPVGQGEAAFGFPRERIKFDGKQVATATAALHADTTACGATPDYLVTVCDACGTASCWHGEMMCDSAKTAGTLTVTASSLVAAGREHPDHFSRAKVSEVCGGIESDREFGDSRVDQDVEVDHKCGATWRMAGDYDTKRCDLEAGHDGAHSAQDGSTLHLDGVEIADLRTGAAFIESALGAAPTVAEMTADLGKLTLPEVIYVKDCECSIAGRARVRIGPPVVCLVCGKAWTRTYGPSNDAPREVQIEIRAAELAYSSLNMNTDEEWSGWYDYDSAVDDRPTPETDSNWAGWLSAAIEDHDQEHPPDGQRNAIRDLANEGLA